MGRLYGSDDYCDEDSWGQRTECDVDNQIRAAEKARMGDLIELSSDDVCDSLPDCVRADNEWRRAALDAKGLKAFNGTGESADDGVSYTDSMYDSQTSGKNYGRKW